MFYKIARVLAIVGAVAMVASMLLSLPNPLLVANFLQRLGIFMACLTLIFAFVDLFDHIYFPKPEAPEAPLVYEYEITHVRADGTIITPDYYVTYPGVIATKPLGYFEFVGDGIDVNGKPTKIWKRRN